MNYGKRNGTLTGKCLPVSFYGFRKGEIRMKGRYKRKDCKDSYRNLMYQMEQEYSLFKYKMLSRIQREIYEKCKQIYFYECLHEYFLYQENITREFLDNVSGKTCVYWELWNLYQQYEHLEVGTWEQIEGMLKFYCHQKKLDNMVEE